MNEEETTEHNQGSSNTDRPNTDAPTDRVPGLQKDASTRDLASSNSRLRDLLVSDRPLGWRNLGWAILSVVAIMTVLLYLTGRAETVAQGVIDRFSAPPIPDLELPVEDPGPASAAGSFALEELPSHPDLMYRPYTSGPILQSELNSSRSARLIPEFRNLLDLYVHRQGVDSNFDIRLIDNRSNEVLEVHTLEEEKRRFEELGEPADYDWGEVDRARRQRQRALVEKYVDRGIPRDAITVRWGRANQVQQARQRNLEYIEHEVNLANYLGLSLLATQISTVETFNQDWLVSPVGARGRYQMMPYILRESNLRHFNLSTAAGNTVQVMEERHPILMMEPSFALLKGYINAVGHEILGISAYHTGPGNIFMVLRRFLTQGTEYVTPSSTVLDGYLWAVTDGFDTVSSSSSFGYHSRGYVASAYGSLRAVEDQPIDTRHTFKADRVELRSDASVHLSELLRALSQHEELDWGYGTEDMTPYERFRHLNPHIRLPEGSDSGGVPVRGDIRLVSRVDGHPLRFFLPIGATDILAREGLDVFDEEATFRYDRDTYPDPNHGAKTMWDRQYDQLVQNITRFGFTNENRRFLFELADRFDELAEENPTHFRKMQQQIIQTHRQLWLTNGWQRLSRAASAAMGTDRAPARPPTHLDTDLQPPALDLQSEN